jgi:hypothetical protein
VRFTGARGDLPVHCADIITVLVRAHVFKLESSASEDRLIFAREHVFDRASALKLKLIEAMFYVVEHVRLRDGLRFSDRYLLK